MARGRMITNQICRDKAIHELADDLSRLAFTWLITFADREGRVFGDPAVIRSTLFPRREDITIKQMTAYITEWSEAGLVVWYEHRGDQWIYFPKFEKNQLGLRKDREPASIIPAYNPDNCRMIAGILPDEIPVKRIEVNGMEGNGKEENGREAPDAFDILQHQIETITNSMPDREAAKAINELLEIGATVEDIQAGYNWITGVAKKRFIYYNQLVGPTKTAISIRLQKNNNGHSPPEGDIYTDAEGKPARLINGSMVTI